MICVRLIHTILHRNYYTESQWQKCMYHYLFIRSVSHIGHMSSKTEVVVLIVMLWGCRPLHKMHIPNKISINLKLSERGPGASYNPPE